MTTRGTVRTWYHDQGWGVIDTDQTPGGCWTHFGSVHVAGYRSPTAGQVVLVEWEVAEQDGYAYRAVRAWPDDEQPVAPGSSTGDSGSAYGSTLTITWDDGTTSTS